MKKTESKVEEVGKEKLKGKENGKETSPWEDWIIICREWNPSENEASKWTHAEIPIFDFLFSLDYE